jgi:formamidopyrimidine-DNA glycosylase
MPELPDVEGFRRYLSRYGTGRPIRSVDVRDGDLLRNHPPQSFRRALEGRTLTRPRRHGKWLLATAGDAEVLMHFGMTGLLKWSAGDEDPHPHDRIVLEFANGRLAYRNMRKFGGVWLARSDPERERATGRLGPDADGLERDEFRDLVGRRRGRVKAVLMKQDVLAGVGNLLADEALWRARIHPGCPANRLSERRLGALHRELQDVVRRSNRRGRIPPDPGWLTGARDDRKSKCPRCGTGLRWTTIGGRTACWCPRCQRR